MIALEVIFCDFSLWSFHSTGTEFVMGYNTMFDTLVRQKCGFGLTLCTMNAKKRGKVFTTHTMLPTPALFISFFTDKV